jgi:hypothetical protein
MITFPKDTPQFSWTRHIKNKMVFYHLSGAQILRIFRKPARREEGIATSTVAAMITRRPAGISKSQSLISKGRSEEIWIMYKLNTAKSQEQIAKSEERRLENKPDGSRLLAPRSLLPKSRITLISAWRYPGVTKPGERPPIPEDVAEMLEKGIY